MAIVIIIGSIPIIIIIGYYCYYYFGQRGRTSLGSATSSVYEVNEVVSVIRWVILYQHRKLLEMLSKLMNFFKITTFPIVYDSSVWATFPIVYGADALKHVYAPSYNGGAARWVLQNHSTSRCA